MSKLTTTPASTVVRHQKILSNRSVKVALAAAAVLGILLALLFMFHTGGPAHYGAGGNIWIM
jgi:hypothetical protein